MEDFVNRESQFPNRRRLEIVSQTPNEIIADIYREEGNVSESGTPITAQMLNDMKNEFANRGTTVNVNGGAQSSINFTSDPQSQINNLSSKINSNINNIQIVQQGLLNKARIINNIYKTSAITFSGQSWQTNSQLNTDFTSKGGDILILINGNMQCNSFISKINYTIDSNNSSSIDDTQSVYFNYETDLDSAVFLAKNVPEGTHTFRFWAQKYGGDGTTVLSAYNSIQIIIIEL